MNTKANDEKDWSFSMRLLILVKSLPVPTKDYTNILWQGGSNTYQKKMFLKLIFNTQN